MDDEKNLNKSDLSDYSARFLELNWDKTKYFYYVFRLGNFTEAARFLHMSQSALSRQISGLEEQLGQPLFTRHIYGVKPTRKGDELGAIVGEIFTTFKAFAHSTENTSNSPRKIRIATTQPLASYILNDHLLDYQEAHPHISFEIMGEDAFIEVYVNDVDIAIRPFDADAKAVQQDYLFSLEKKLYASPIYLKKYGEPQSVEEMQHHKVIAPGNLGNQPYADVNWICHLGMPKGKINIPVYSATSLECNVKAACKGLGIIANYEQMTLIQESALINILPQVTGDIIRDYFTYPNHLKNDKDILNLRDFLKERLGTSE